MCKCVCVYWLLSLWEPQETGNDCDIILTGANKCVCVRCQLLGCWAQGVIITNEVASVTERNLAVLYLLLLFLIPDVLPIHTLILCSLWVPPIKNWKGQVSSRVIDSSIFILLQETLISYSSVCMCGFSSSVGSEVVWLMLSFVLTQTTKDTE